MLKLARIGRDGSNRFSNVEVSIGAVDRGPSRTTLGLIGLSARRCVVIVAFIRMFCLETLYCLSIRLFRVLVYQQHILRSPISPGFQDVW